MSIYRIVMSWLWPALFATTVMRSLVELLPTLAAGYFYIPLSGLMVFLFRETLIDVFGMHTRVTYKMVTMTKEEYMKEKEEEENEAKIH
jgi:hypothetical protein